MMMFMIVLVIVFVFVTSAVFVFTSHSSFLLSYDRYKTMNDSSLSKN